MEGREEEGGAAEDEAAAAEEPAPLAGWGCGEEEILLVDERVRFREGRVAGSGAPDEAGPVAEARRLDCPLLGRSDAGGGGCWLFVRLEALAVEWRLAAADEEAGLEALLGRIVLWCDVVVAAVDARLERDLVLGVEAVGLLLFRVLVAAERVSSVLA